jgi:hypothetical protein
MEFYLLIVIRVISVKINRHISDCFKSTDGQTSHINLLDVNGTFVSLQLDWWENLIETEKLDHTDLSVT